MHYFLIKYIRYVPNNEAINSKHWSWRWNKLKVIYSRLGLALGYATNFILKLIACSHSSNNFEVASNGFGVSISTLHILKNYSNSWRCRILNKTDGRIFGMRVILMQFWE